MLFIDPLSMPELDVNVPMVIMIVVVIVIMIAKVVMIVMMVMITLLVVEFLGYCCASRLG